MASHQQLVQLPAPALASDSVAFRIRAVAGCGGGHDFWLPGPCVLCLVPSQRSFFAGSAISISRWQLCR